MHRPNEVLPRRSPGNPPSRSKSKPDFRAPYPGHTLFQDCFFVCDVKGVAGAGNLGKIFVQLVVDSNSGLAFAKVYPTESPMDAIDILESHVLPYFKRFGAPVERIVTPARRGFADRPLEYALEIFLSASRIDHLHMDLTSESHSRSCDQFYRFLAREFFAPALRRNYHQSFAKLQQELDVFVEAYNHLPEGNAR